MEGATWATMGLLHKSYWSFIVFVLGKNALRCLLELLVSLIVDEGLVHDAKQGQVIRKEQTFVK